MWTCRADKSAVGVGGNVATLQNEERKLVDQRKPGRDSESQRIYVSIVDRMKKRDEKGPEGSNCVFRIICVVIRWRICEKESDKEW